MRSTLNKRSSSRSPRRSSVSAALIRDGRNYSNGYLNALWQWRKVKTATDSVVQSLEKQFLIDDTAINTSLLTTRLDNLEKLLRKAGMISINIWLLKISIIRYDIPIKGRCNQN